MLATLRTYRFVSALVAVVLLAGTSVPLMQHLCTEGQIRFKVVSSECCCEEDRSHGSHHDHGMPHGAMAHDLGTHVAHQPPLPVSAEACPHESQPTPANDCCNVEVVQADLDQLLLTKLTDDGLTAPLLLAWTDIDGLRDATPEVRLSVDTGPPPLPAPLHILHQVFLN